MRVEAGRRGVDWLAEAAAAAEVHTVRVAWADRLGTLRGKRLPVDLFLSSPERRIAFCDGMIVVDVNCDVIQETPFSNFETGYPDMYLRPELETLVEVGWAEGEALVLGQLEDHEGVPLAVAPRNVLRRIVSRLAEDAVEVGARLSVSGRLMKGRGEPFRLFPDGLGGSEDPPGILREAVDGLVASGVAVRWLQTDREGGFRLSLDSLSPVDAADQAVIAKAALKELARARGVDAVFMSALPGLPRSGQLGVELRLSGVEVDPIDLQRRFACVRALLQPSINAFRLGPVPSPAARRVDGATVLTGLVAASEADPATALAAFAASIGAGREGGHAVFDVPEPEGLDGAASVLEVNDWTRTWLGDAFVDNTVPLLRHEAAIFRAAVTDWELDRYWSAG
ncbi:MAG: hypothetical protein R2725_11335 [Solirubrobacterales bacterium]